MEPGPGFPGTGAIPEPPDTTDRGAADHAAAHRADVRLLGPIEVTGPAGPAVLVGGRQRALLGLLALSAGSVTAQSRLVAALWGSQPPRTAVKTLHSHVARVRQALAACGLPDVLVTREPGYALGLDRTNVDAWRFEELVREGRRDLTAGRTAGGVDRLRTALGLWRGDAFEDGPPAGWGAAEVTRLHEVRLTTLEDVWDARLRLGEHVAAVGELERLLVANPHRERLVGLLMLALYRCGRQADAMEAYQRFRLALADETGLDPGPDLQRLNTALLRRDPTLDLDAPPPRTEKITVPGPRPGQLPPAMGHFVGRRVELGDLDRLLADGDGNPGVAVVSGPAGMGKTALVLHWSHRVRDRFPDGQLFLDLRGHDRDAAVPPAEALGRLLPALGVPVDRIPADLDDRAAVYRSLLAGRRILVVLDNARSADDLRPLVPGTPTSLLMATSRHQLASLGTHHAVHAVRLDVLDRSDALDLLTRVLGTSRVEAEPAAADRLVELCGRLPLALRIVAAKLAARPRRPIAVLVDDLASQDRLDALSVEGDSRSVRTVFASAYRDLSPAAARLFRLLGLHPGPTFAAHLGAALARAPLPATRAALDELAAAHLVTEVAADRYRRHDLIRLYAHECVRRDEPPHEQAAAVERLLDWYLAVAAAANSVLDPSRDRVVPDIGHRPAELPFAAESHATLEFLDGERDNLAPVTAYAAEHGHETAAWQLTYLLTGYFDARGHWSDRVEICRWGLAAAQRCHDPATEGLMRSGLGNAYIMSGRFADALDHLGHALILMQAAGDRRGEGNVYNNLAVAHNGLRHFDDAVSAFERALAVHTANDYPVGIAFALNNIGHVYTRMGRSELSFAYLERALAISRAQEHLPLEATALQSLGEAHLARADPDAAVARLSAALAVHRRIGERQQEAVTLNHLGTARLVQGEVRVALERFGESATLARELGDPHLESTARANLARAELRLRRPEAARDQIRLAMALRARSPDPVEEADLRHLAEELAV